MNQQQSAEQDFLANIKASLRNVVYVDEDSSFPPFYEDVALFLKNEENEDVQFCADVIRSLYSYRIKTQKNIKAVTRPADRDKFKVKLSKCDIPPATCNALYDKFVYAAKAKKQQQSGEQDFLACIKASLRNVDDVDDDDSSLLPFYGDVALFLKNEKNRKGSLIVQTLKGLQSFDIESLEDLKAVTRPPDRDKFSDELHKYDIPPAICNALYDKFVDDLKANKQQQEEQQQQSFVRPKEMMHGIASWPSRPDAVSSHGKPPLHPDVAAFVDVITEKMDRVFGKSPSHTPAHVGFQVREVLEKEGYIHSHSPSQHPDKPSILSSDQLSELSQLTTEKEIVSFITPHLERVAKGKNDLVSFGVYNSEHYSWIQTNKDTTKFNQPDLCICHPCIIKKKEPPSRSANNEGLIPSHCENNHFGVIADWRLRCFIGLTCEAKIEIDDRGLGEVANYGRYICFGKHAPYLTKLLLFDKREFWLVTSTGGKVSMITKCGWTLGGSWGLLQDFLSQPTMPKLVQTACKHFNLCPVGSDSFLGAGGYGFVFRAQRTGGCNTNWLALKVVLRAGIQRLELEAAALKQARKRCPDVVIGLEDNGFQVFGDMGAALLLSSVGEHYSKLAPQAIVESLRDLHRNDILHGDARLENVVCIEGKPCWIDFATAFLGHGDINTSKQAEMDHFLQDVKDRFYGYTPR